MTDATPADATLPTPQPLQPRARAAETRRVATARWLAGAAALWAAAVGAVVLAGWAADVATLKSVFPGLVTMKANTALAFALAGAALWTLRSQQPGASGRRCASICALVVAAIGAATLLEYLVGWQLGIDQVLFREPPSVADTSAAGRMSPMTAVNLVLFGLAVVSADWLVARPVWTPLVLVVLSGGGLAIVGYFYHLTPLYRIPTFTAMAVHTALTFVVLAVGLLCARPERGLVAMLTNATAGGTAARRLVPVALLAPLLFGWLGLAGLQRRLYAPELAVAFLALANGLAVSAVVWWSARSLQRTDLARLQNEAAVLRSQVLFARMFDMAPDAVLLVATDGAIGKANRQAATLFGCRDASELIGRPVEALMPEGARAAHVHRRSEFEAAPVIRPMGTGRELRAQRRNGTEFPVEISLSPVETDEGVMTLCVVHDVTERRRVETQIRDVNVGLEQLVRERTVELENAVKELDAFSYSVSHDLRAPLRAIDGFSRILITQHAAELSPEAGALLQTVRASTERMGWLIDDLLAFARLSRQPLSKREVSPLDVVHEVLAELYAAQRSRIGDVVVSALPACLADPALLRLVWMNLLSNALKYTSRTPTPRIEVGCRPNGEPVYFVRDNGVGFKMAYADQLFGVFQRLHRAEDYEGTGVGLAIVQRVIHRHGGRVWAEAAPDKGATFFFTLEPTQAT